MTPISLTEADVAALLTMPEAISVLRGAFSAQANGNAENHPRERFFVPGGVLHHMAAAWPGRGVMGTKTYTSFSTGTRFWVQLFSATSGDLLACIEADKLGQIRTGAATGVAAEYLARPDSRVAALLGTGGQARTQAAALAHALPRLEEIRAFGRDGQRREQFCRELSEMLPCRVVPAESVLAATENADVVVTATTAREPILTGERLRPGVFVAAVGANRITAREISEAVISLADVVVVDDVAQARQESGELIFAHEKRRFAWEKARPLSQIVAGHAPGRTNDTQITLFKSLGIALEDIAVAAVVYEKALAAKIGETRAG